jgi:glycosyltransferase involved in cell wall biosynthesis
MTKPKLKIAIATAGRFHVLNLACELARLGHDVRFYSYVPRARAIDFGLPAECHVDLFPALLPFAIWQTKFGHVAPKLCEKLTWKALNQAVKSKLTECDVFIFMSGIYLEAALFAKEKYGAALILERGSQHILAQNEILAQSPDSSRPTALSIQRELKGYDIADWISIPSVTVEASFERYTDAYAKLIRNPYGVDLQQFPLKQRLRTGGKINLVFAGLWSFQKGCDVILDALADLHHVNLLHVGDIGDLEFPSNHPRFQHLPKVDQKQLTNIYQQSDAFVLASRQDGFGMVLSQALATGLPVVCTTNTGGPDLCLTPALTDRITIVDTGDKNALQAGIVALAQRLSNGPGFLPLKKEDLDALGWAAYGKRYVENLTRLIG